MPESGRLDSGQDVHFQGHRSPGRSQAGTSSVRVIERRRGVAILSPRIKTGFRRVSRLVMIATYRLHLPHLYNLLLISKAADTIEAAGGIQGVRIASE